MASIPKRKLGRTGLEVTVLGFGAMELRGSTGFRSGRPMAPGQAGKALNAVLASGINFIDTSPDYGESEEDIGKYISNRRGEFLLASKCGCIVGSSGPQAGGPRHIYTRENIIAGVEQSLKRMKTDHLDLVQLHGNPTKQTLEQENVVQTLQDLKRQGKVRSIGSSSNLPELADLIPMKAFDAFQIPYSALQSEHYSTISQAAKAGAGTVIRGGVARGPLQTGRLSEQAVWALWDKAKLGELLEHGMTQMEFLLRFTITHPGLSTTIVGSLDPAHISQNAKSAAKGPLPASLYNEAKRRLASVGAKEG